MLEIIHVSLVYLRKSENNDYYVSYDKLKCFEALEYT